MYEGRCRKLEEMRPELFKANEKIQALESETAKLLEKVKIGAEHKRQLDYGKINFTQLQKAKAEVDKSYKEECRLHNRTSKKLEAAENHKNKLQSEVSEFRDKVFDYEKLYSKKR